VREAVLQQSALSANDASCSPAKQSALARAVLDVHDTAVALGKAGTPATVIEGFDFRPLIRAKDTTAPDDAAGVTAIATETCEALKQVSR
jgi:V/A-type H+-transporting ATPase subunit A